MTDRRTFVVSAAATTGTALLPGAARAPAFPKKPIRLICSWTAGGTTDIVMRSRAESASRILGRNVLIDAEGAVRHDE